MVLVDIQLEEPYECLVATAIIIKQWVLMAWYHQAGGELQVPHAFPEENLNEN